MFIFISSFICGKGSLGLEKIKKEIRGKRGQEMIKKEISGKRGLYSFYS